MTSPTSHQKDVGFRLGEMIQKHGRKSSGVGLSKISYFHPEKLGEIMIQFEKIIFVQMGWFNHHLVTHFGGVAIFGFRFFFGGGCSFQ